ncbi:ABC transporter permease [Roseburia sp. AM51-8]|jgi:putative ABC transport system permease protein|uniref:ABC transporter permease n=1 Tax=Roseburia lenta TaxID=2763061 RepID=A0ABR7GDZ6_9FIRM|nr:MULTISPECIES: ABC transporter permease [Roseburia]MBC5685662.1 ABC transporter permease [Roseburia lenta]MDY3872330.1 ABC transporter permease [Roseburia lenta]RHO31748.1 ABC transporter permease [Roseburia sp. AM16-25]RHQ02125.1 ABC transporter permease [Roseburia sp. AM51-8]
MTLVISVFEQGMIYAIMALGMYITYKILDFPDMTVDGSFPLGASLSAVLISQGMNPYLTLLLSFAAGLMAGTITGLIHVKLKVRDILASIIMMTALYSVNLRIAGKANLPIYNYDNIYNNSLTNHLLGGALSPYKNLIIIAIIVVIVKCVLDWYLKTKSGYLLKAVGDNETLVTSMGIDKGKIKILGLAIANGLVSLSGSMFAQQQRFFDASMGVGTAVIGLASVIIGTALFGQISVFGFSISVILGSILYKGCVAAAIRIGLQSTDLKLVTAVLFLLILVLSSRIEKYQGRKRRKERA